MQRHIRYIADYPAIVRRRRDVEQFAGSKRYDRAILKRRRRLSRHHQTNVYRPLPARLIRRAADRETPDPNNFEAPEHHLPNFVWTLKSLKDGRVFVGAAGREERRRGNPGGRGRLGVQATARTKCQE